MDEDIRQLSIEENTTSAEVVNPSQDEVEIFNSTPEIIYHISEFDGPLDLLVTLIHDNKIEIEDLFISEVTSQYVEIIKNTPKEDHLEDLQTIKRHLPS